MTSIDDLFKSHTSRPNKRKLSAPTNPADSYKSAKHTLNGTAKTTQAQAQASEADAPEAEDEDDDVDAGPQLPEDGEQGPDDDDEDGRFFGSGVDTKGQDALDYLDAQDDGADAPEEINSAWLKRTAQTFERRIAKNAELRSKFEAEPAKFMDSEAELDVDIKLWSIVTDHAELYTELVKSGTVERLVGLLAHENTDIAIQSLAILAELTDEDVAVEEKDWERVVDAMLDADLPALLIENLERLDESEEADRSGVYHSLSLVENLASYTKAAETLAKDSALLEYLLARIRREGTAVSQNKQYAAEILAILCQSSPVIRNKAIRHDAVEILLELVNGFRRRDPSQDSDEEEYAENLFDALAALVDEVAGKADFVKSEGVELCLLMIKEGKFGKPRSLRVLDHAAASPTGGVTGIDVCEKIVESAGLKPLFAVFAKKNDKADLEHILGVFASMLRSLPGDSAPRIRLLAKFLEKNYEKITRLIDLRKGYLSKLKPVEARIEAERGGLGSGDTGDLELEWLSQRMDAGLFSLQTIDVILAWLVAEDGGAKSHITQTLARLGDSLVSVRRTLEEQLSDLKDAQTDDQRNTADMLQTLVGFLD